MTHVTGSTQQLRTHVVTLEATFGKNVSAAFRPLSSMYKLWFRRLVRVVDCPDLDALVAAQSGLDQMREALEAAHGRNAIAGVQQVRRAFDGVQAYLDAVPLAEAGAEPRPDRQLDIPQGGPVAEAIRRVGAMQRAWSPQQASASIAEKVPRGPRQTTRRVARRKGAVVRTQKVAA